MAAGPAWMMLRAEMVVALAGVRKLRPVLVKKLLIALAGMTSENESIAKLWTILVEVLALTSVQRCSVR